MSLRVWLPLINDYKNQGLSDLTFAPISTSNTSQQSPGKIGGKCYCNNSYAGGGLISNKPISLGTTQTMCCWVKFSSLMDGAALGGTMGGQHRYSNCTGMGLTIKYISASTGYLSLNTGNGAGSRTYNTYCGNTLLQANTWYHVAFTYDGSTIIFYVNGKFDGSHKYSGQVNVNDYVIVGAWSLEGASGPTIHANYKLDGYINDFRIYDHVLSAKEIKEISKGLALHYQLKGNGKVNYLKGAGQFTESNPLIRNASDVSHMNDSYVYHNGVLSAQLFVSGRYTFSAMCDGNPTAHPTSGTTASQRLFSFFLQNTSTGNHYHMQCHRGADGRCYTTFDLPAGTYSIRTNLYAADNVNYTLRFWDMKLSLGEYDPNDIWCPHVDDETYSLLGFGAGNEPDCSGFGNNGDKNDTFVAVGGSPRYGNCYDFNGTFRLTNTTLDTTGWTDATVCAWVNPAKFGNGHDRSCIVIGGLYLTIDTDGKIGTYFYGKTKEGYHTTSESIPIGQWSHIAGVWDNASATHKIYINGVEKLTVTSCSGAATSNHTKKEVGMENSNRPYYGQISDVRIYATALSASDMADLYKTSASLIKDGHLMAYDFRENQQNAIDKTGIVSTSGFNTKSIPTYDMKVKALPDGSSWARIHNLDLTKDKAFFASASEVAKCTDKHNRYSRMGIVDKYKAGSEYEFMLTYPSIKKSVPQGYIELDYIEATGAQYIKTGVVGAAKWEFDIQFTNTTKRQLMGYGGTGSEYWGSQENGMYGLATWGYMNVASGGRDTIVHDYTGNNSLWVKNVTWGISQTDVSSKEYQIFAIDGGYLCHAKLYRCKCIQNGALIRDFVPAMRVSDGYVGLFDIVNNVFYGNSGSSAFYCNYTWLDYIESTGTQYINTGVAPTSDMEVEIAFTPTGGLTENSIFGSSWSASGYFLMFYHNQIRWHSGGAWVDIGSYKAGDRVLCHCTNSYIEVNGVRYSISGGANSSDGITILGDMGIGSSFRGVGRIEYVKMWSGGSLIRDFVPCLNNGTPGLCDKVTGVFYGNAGSGSFKYGYRNNGIRYLDYILNTGVQYINTGYNASSNTRIVYDFEYISGDSAWIPILGQRRTIGSNMFAVWVNGNSHEMAVNYGTVDTSTIAGTNCYGRHTYSNIGNQWYLDGRLVSTISTGSFTTSAPLIFWGLNNESGGVETRNCVGKIYSLKIYEGDTQVRNYLPAVNSAGKSGLYCTITKRFYVNAGSSYIIPGTTKESVTLYNRWIQTSSPNATSVTGFKPISTSWSGHNYGIRKHGTSCLYNCDSGDTWYAPIGQYYIWEGGIPACDGTPQSQTELWVRTDRFADATQFKIYNGSMTAKDYTEI